MQKPLDRQGASGLTQRSDCHKAPVKDGFMLIPKPGVTPVFEVVDFISHQNPDSLSELFFKQQSVKTHFGEYSFDIVQHGKESYGLFVNEFMISR